MKKNAAQPCQPPATKSDLTTQKNMFGHSLKVVNEFNKVKNKY